MGSVTTKKHSNGLEYVDVDTPLCKARIFLQGAQIDLFQPVGKAPLLWVSSADDYQPGSGIRGGIPVCWPWFGQSDNPDWPQHGFARTRIWALESVQMKNQAVELKLTLKISEADKLYWPHDTRVEMLFTLTDTLTVSLKNTNLASYPVSLTQALHSYFPVKDIHQLKATGFKGSKYIEFGEGPFKQNGDEVLFDKETDRVYTQLADVQELHTPDGIIEVSRENSHSAVLWNPWIDKSQRLSRFNSDDYQTMVCLEAANVLEDKLTLAPDETHMLTTKIGWKD
ncbi:D-hexose-6-phosphate mutarotase [Shewanella psychropiezotolerans]|uniref:Putative glucose-6-phosphate 1-epimerase n=1 Tax=Shewanella psychropiezotolerans TaxID=2593655 RepID=A0ABX5X0V5_9GAMM|nr:MULTISPECIES: D-hexose-6-phosphate mutarotase [Shewanella]MPY26207.1 D-hexose-6-phosphate mutarotase [Shewanella sp. YLB-07]QDO84633.1 D-hexose-6-phosphate mutarotase [Shewanella psychropiezotolerans]